MVVRLTRAHIPHNPRVRESSESTESLLENLIVDLRGEISNKDVEVTLGVLLFGFGRKRKVVISLVRASALSSSFLLFEGGKKGKRERERWDEPPCSAVPGKPSCT